MLKSDRDGKAGLPESPSEGPGACANAFRKTKVHINDIICIFFIIHYSVVLYSTLLFVRIPSIASKS